MATDENKKIKKKGPVRFEAIIPIFVLSALTFLYFSYYFDLHMKKVFEYVGTQVNGAEVNIDSVQTSFIMGSFDLNRLQVTNPESPSLNALEIENIHFKYLWDALLRMKFVVEDASITNVQLSKPRVKPGNVLPPKPASPSQLEKIQDQVLGQIKNKYGGNMLGDIMDLLEGSNYQEKVREVQGTLKSEERVKSMLTEVSIQKGQWNKKIKEISDTKKVKEIELTLNKVKSEKNFLKQAEGINKLSNLLKDVEKQYSEIKKSSKLIESEIKNISQYPDELQSIVNEDIASLKSRFSIPKIDFKDMAMNLFAGQFAGYIVKARKYQAVADQYIPEKKKEENIVVPRRRSEGKNYHFPITAGYPFFWLKRAAISSTGTTESYSGNVSGEITNITTSPKQIAKPIILEMKGDFPSSKIFGTTLRFTADFTKEIAKHTGILKVSSFEAPEKMFVDDNKLKFGLTSAAGSTTVKATIQEQNISMEWISSLTKPKFIVETKNKMAKEIISNVVNDISKINIDGTANGTYTNLDMNITSNLGTELGQGFEREIGAKVTEAQNKIQAMINEKINKPKQELMAALSSNSQYVKSLSNLEEVYKKNEVRIREEIKKLQKSGQVDKLKEQGKKLLKGFKL